MEHRSDRRWGARNPTHAHKAVVNDCRTLPGLGSGRWVRKKKSTYACTKPACRISTQFRWRGSCARAAALSDDDSVDGTIAPARPGDGAALAAGTAASAIGGNTNGPDREDAMPFSRRRAGAIDDFMLFTVTPAAASPRTACRGDGPRGRDATGNQRGRAGDPVPSGESGPSQPGATAVSYGNTRSSGAKGARGARGRRFKVA